MCTIVDDLISGQTISCKNESIAKTVAQQRLSYHNSTFAYNHRGIHYPSDAIIIYELNRIVIRRRQL